MNDKKTQIHFTEHFTCQCGNKTTAKGRPCDRCISEQIAESEGFSKYEIASIHDELEPNTYNRRLSAGFNMLHLNQ